MSTVCVTFKIFGSSCLFNKTKNIPSYYTGSPSHCHIMSLLNNYGCYKREKYKLLMESLNFFFFLRNFSLFCCKILWMKFLGFINSKRQNDTSTRLACLWTLRHASRYCYVFVPCYDTTVLHSAEQWNMSKKQTMAIRCLPHHFVRTPTIGTGKCCDVIPCRYSPHKLHNSLKATQQGAWLNIR
jgi:hypothetical protein